MQSELKDKCILNIVFLTSLGQNYCHTSLKLKGSGLNLSLNYLNLERISKLSNICSRQSSVSKLCILAFHAEKRMYSFRFSAALWLFSSFCLSHAGNHRQDLGNVSYYYYSHARVAPLQIFSWVFISGRDYGLWVVAVT